MVDLVHKEQICKLKVKTLEILNQVIEDELYSKSRLIQDLTNLLAFLEQMEEMVHRVVTEK